MNWLKGDEKEHIRRLACLKPSQETCGFVLEDGHVVEVENKADDPVNQFVIDHETYAEYEEEIKGVWHSHLELAERSIGLTGWYAMGSVGRCEKHLWNREEDEDGGRTVDEWMECGRG